MSAAGISGASRIAGFGEGTPQQVSREGQNRRIADFGTVVETCSKYAADCPSPGFSVHRANGAGLSARCSLPFFFRQYYSAEGLCYPLAALFFFSAKDTFERPPATRWTGIFSNFLSPSVIRATGILATGGAENFCFHSLQRQQIWQNGGNIRAGKFLPSFASYIPDRGQKWPGARTGNKKSSKSFSDLLLSLVRRWRLVFSFEWLGLAGIVR